MTYANTFCRWGGGILLGFTLATSPLIAEQARSPIEAPAKSNYKQSLRTLVKAGIPIDTSQSWEGTQDQLVVFLPDIAHGDADVQTYNNKVSLKIVDAIDPTVGLEGLIGNINPKKRAEILKYRPPIEEDLVRYYRGLQRTPMEEKERAFLFRYYIEMAANLHDDYSRRPFSAPGRGLLAALPEETQIFGLEEEKTDILGTQAAQLHGLRGHLPINKEDFIDYFTQEVGKEERVRMMNVIALHRELQSAMKKKAASLYKELGIDADCSDKVFAAEREKRTVTIRNGSWIKNLQSQEEVVYIMAGAGHQADLLSRLKHEGISYISVLPYTQK